MSRSGRDVNMGKFSIKAIRSDFEVEFVNRVLDYGNHVPQNLEVLDLELGALPHILRVGDVFITDTMYNSSVHGMCIVGMYISGIVYELSSYHRYNIRNVIMVNDDGNTVDDLDDVSYYQFDGTEINSMLIIDFCTMVLRGTIPLFDICEWNSI